MPEITSVEAIHGKLAEFDRHAQDVLAAVRTLVQIKGEAEARLADIRITSEKSREAQVAAEELRAKVGGILGEWEHLKEQVAQAGQRLADENHAALAAQADLLSGLEASTRASAVTAESASASVVEVAGTVQALVATVRQELGSEVRTRLSQAEELIESETQRVEQYLEQEQTRLTETATRQREEMQQRVEEEISSFKEEMRRQLSEHRQAIDRQLTNFLNKQNAMIRNLTQQIDGYDRAARVQSARHEELAASVAELGTRIEANRGELSSLATRLGSVEASAERLASGLGETLVKLRDLPILGRRFA